MMDLFKSWLKRLKGGLKKPEIEEPERDPSREEDVEAEDEYEDWEDYRAELWRWQAWMAKKQWELEQKHKQDYIQ